VDAFAARLLAGGAGAYPLVFQRFPEPVGVATPVGVQPICGWHALEPNGGQRTLLRLSCNSPASVRFPPSTPVLRRISAQNLHPIETDGTRSLRHA
jgi:hypothetical protein